MYHYLLLSHMTIILLILCFPTAGLSATNCRIIAIVVPIVIFLVVASVFILCCYCKGKKGMHIFYLNKTQH